MANMIDVSRMRGLIISWFWLKSAVSCYIINFKLVFFALFYFDNFLSCNSHGCTLASFCSFPTSGDYLHVFDLCLVNLPSCPCASSAPCLLFCSLLFLDPSLLPCVFSVLPLCLSTFSCVQVSPPPTPPLHHLHCEQLHFMTNLELGRCVH